MRPLVLALAALLLVPVAARAETIPLDTLPDTRVGEVRGTRAFVGISLERGRVRAYVCDGTLQRDATVSQWFTGRWDGRSAITLKAGGHELRLRGAARGSFDGHAFRVRRVTMPAGVFERPGRTSWIVLADGRKRGAFVPTRPPKCRVVLVTGSSGQQQWVTVC